MNLVRGKFRVRGDTIEVHPAYEEHARAHRALRRRHRAHQPHRPRHRRAPGRDRRPHDLPRHPLRHRRGAHEARHRRHRGGAAGAAGLVREGGQAARGPAPAHAHAVRPRDDAGGRLLQRHRELLDAHRRPEPGRGAVHAARLLPRRLPARHRRVARHRPPAARPVRGRPLPQGDARRPRLPPAVGAPTTGRCASTSSTSASTSASSCRPRPSPYEIQQSDGRVVEQIVRPTGLVDPEVVVKPTKGQIDDLIEADQRRVDRAAERVLVTTLTKKMAEDLTDYLLEMGLRVPLPAQRGRHHPAHRDPPRPPPGRVRRARRHQPAAGGPRPPRGVARRHPRRRQGGLPPQRDVADPDHGPGGAQRRRPGGHVRRQRHRLDAAGHLRDHRGAAGVQQAYNAEHGIDPQTIRKAVTDILATLRPDDEAPGARPRAAGRRQRDKAPQRLRRAARTTS